MQRNSLRCLAFAFCLGLLGLAPGAQARDLTVALQSGIGLGSAAALRAVYLDPFKANFPQLAVTSWAGGLDALRAGASGWDVVETDAGTLRAGCADGLLEKLPWGEPPLAAGLRDKMLPQGVTECGLGVLMHATVLAWDRGKVQGSPSWADFWDVVKVPGKRALQAGARGNLEFALLADGVLPADVYRTLNTPAGVERALRKLLQLRPYLVWWRTPEEALHILQSGEALMASMPAPLVVSANLQGGQLAMQPSGGLVEIQYFAIAKDSPNKAEALKLLAFAADPARQAMLPEQGAWGGLAKGANDKLPADQLARSPSSAAALAAEVVLDAGFWRDNDEKLTARLDAMVAR
jgi:putative spermidine/putrescine transport system substrate-binding protein